MACIKTFDNVVGTGLLTGNFSTNGTFTYLGYSTTEGGTYDVNNGNWPWSTNTWGASVDVSNVESGFYKFLYHSNLPDTDPCYDDFEFIVPVVQGTADVPAGPINIALCSGDAIANIFNDSGLYDKAAILPVDCSIGGTGVASPGYSDNGTPDDISDDTFDPSVLGSYPATVTFDITYTPVAPPGYTLDSCTNCEEKVLQVAYQVTEQFQVGDSNDIAVCNDGDI